MCTRSGTFAGGSRVMIQRSGTSRRGCSFQARTPRFFDRQTARRRGQHARQSFRLGHATNLAFRRSAVAAAVRTPEVAPAGRLRGVGGGAAAAQARFGESVAAPPPWFGAGLSVAAAYSNRGNPTRTTLAI